MLLGMFWLSCFSVVGDGYLELELIEIDIILVSLINNIIQLIDRMAYPKIPKNAQKMGLVLDMMKAHKTQLLKPMCKLALTSQILTITTQKMATQRKFILQLQVVILFLLYTRGVFIVIGVFLHNADYSQVKKRITKISQGHQEQMLNMRFNINKEIFNSKQNRKTSISNTEMLHLNKSDIRSEQPESKNVNNNLALGTVQAQGMSKSQKIQNNSQSYNLHDPETHPLLNACPLNQPYDPIKCLKKYRMFGSKKATPSYSLILKADGIHKHHNQDIDSAVPSSFQQQDPSSSHQNYRKDNFRKLYGSKKEIPPSLTIIHPDMRAQEVYPERSRPVSQQPYTMPTKNTGKNIARNSSLSKFRMIGTHLKIPPLISQISEDGTEHIKVNNYRDSVEKLKLRNQNEGKYGQVFENRNLDIQAKQGKQKKQEQQEQRKSRKSRKQGEHTVFEERKSNQVDDSRFENSKFKGKTQNSFASVDNKDEDSFEVHAEKFKQAHKKFIFESSNPIQENSKKKINKSEEQLGNNSSVFKQTHSEMQNKSFIKPTTAIPASQMPSVVLTAKKKIKAYVEYVDIDSKDPRHLRRRQILEADKHKEINQEHSVIYKKKKQDPIPNQFVIKEEPEDQDKSESARQKNTIKLESIRNMRNMDEGTPPENKETEIMVQVQNPKEKQCEKTKQNQEKKSSKKLEKKSMAVINSSKSISAYFEFIDDTNDQPVQQIQPVQPVQPQAVTSDSKKTIKKITLIGSQKNIHAYRQEILKPEPVQDNHYEMSSDGIIEDEIERDLENTVNNLIINEPVNTSQQFLIHSAAQNESKKDTNKSIDSERKRESQQKIINECKKDSQQKIGNSEQKPSQNQQQRVKSTKNFIKEEAKDLYNKIQFNVLEKKKNGQIMSEEQENVYNQENDYVDENKISGQQSIISNHEQSVNQQQKKEEQQKSMGKLESSRKLIPSIKNINAYIQIIPQNKQQEAVCPQQSRQEPSLVEKQHASSSSKQLIEKQVKSKSTIPAQMEIINQVEAKSLNIFFINLDAYPAMEWETGFDKLLACPYQLGSRDDFKKKPTSLTIVNDQDKPVSKQNVGSAQKIPCIKNVNAYTVNVQEENAQTANSKSQAIKQDTRKVEELEHKKSQKILPPPPPLENLGNSKHSFCNSKQNISRVSGEVLNGSKASQQVKRQSSRPGNMEVQPSARTQIQSLAEKIEPNHQTQQAQVPKLRTSSHSISGENKKDCSAEPEPRTTRPTNKLEQAEQNSVSQEKEKNKVYEKSHNNEKEQKIVESEKNMKKSKNNIQCSIAVPADINTNSNQNITEAPQILQQKLGNKQSTNQEIKKQETIQEKSKLSPRQSKQINSPKGVQKIQIQESNQDEKKDVQAHKSQIERQKQAVKVERQKQAVKVEIQKQTVKVEIQKQTVKVERQKQAVKVERQKQAVKVERQKQAVKVERQKQTVKVNILTAPKDKQQISQINKKPVEEKEDKLIEDKKNEEKSTERKEKQQSNSRRDENKQVQRKVQGSRSSKQIKKTGNPQRDSVKQKKELMKVSNAGKLFLSNHPDKKQEVVDAKMIQKQLGKELEKETNQKKGSNFAVTTKNTTRSSKEENEYQKSHLRIDPVTSAGHMERTLSNRSAAKPQENNKQSLKTLIRVSPKLQQSQPKLCDNEAMENVMQECKEDCPTEEFYRSKQQTSIKRQSNPNIESENKNIVLTKMGLGKLKDNQSKKKLEVSKTKAMRGNQQWTMKKKIEESFNKIENSSSRERSNRKPKNLSPYMQSAFTMLKLDGPKKERNFQSGDSEKENQHESSRSKLCKDGSGRKNRINLNYNDRQIQKMMIQYEKIKKSEESSQQRSAKFKKVRSTELQRFPKKESGSQQKIQSHKFLKAHSHQFSYLYPTTEGGDNDKLANKAKELNKKLKRTSYVLGKKREADEVHEFISEARKEVGFSRKFLDDLE